MLHVKLAGQRSSRRIGMGFRELLLLGIGVTGGIVACSNIEPVAPSSGPITDPAQLYNRLVFDRPAVTMSTDQRYNTVRLTAIPRDVLGSPMSGLPTPVYRSADTTQVVVTPDGVVTALAPTTGVVVAASLTVGPVTRVDTAIVQVTTLTSPPELGSLSIHPVAPDSVVWPLRRTTAIFDQVAPLIFFYAGYFRPGDLLGPRLASHMLSTTGDTLTDLPVGYESLDPSVAIVEPQSGRVQTLRLGPVRMVAKAMAYGVVKADTVTFTVTPQAVDEITIAAGATGVLGFAPNDILIRPYGVVVWRNLNVAADTVDVTFDDPAHVMPGPAAICNVALFFFPDAVDPSSSCLESGNISLPGTDPNVYGWGTLGIRQFTVPGVYTYHSTRTGATGRIQVSSDLTGW